MTGSQRIDGQGKIDKPGRTGGRGCDGGASQVQLVGKPCCGKILVIAECHAIPDRIGAVAQAITQAVDQIGRETDADISPNRAVTCGIARSVFQSAKGDFKQQTLLRIGFDGFPRGHGKRCGIEHIEIVKNPMAGDEIGVFERRRIAAHCAQAGNIDVLYLIDTVFKHRPECVAVIRAGQAHRHANNRNVVIFRHIALGLYRFGLCGFGGMLITRTKVTCEGINGRVLEYFHRCNVAPGEF